MRTDIWSNKHEKGYNSRKNQSSPFHVCLTIRRPHILCTQLVICLLSHFIHIWYLGWPWSEHPHIIPISRMVDFCESYSLFHVCLTIRPSACSDHGQPRYQIWIKSNKRQVTSCEHKMCERTYYQTNHIMSISQMVDFCESYSTFHVCLTIRPSGHLVYATSLWTQDVRTDILSNKHEKGYNSRKNQPSVKSV
jgi:hypothetical protein